MFNDIILTRDKNDTVENIFANDIINSIGLEVSENLDAASMIFSPFGIAVILSLIQIATIGSTSEQLQSILGTNFDMDQIKNMYEQYSSEAMKMVNVFIFNRAKNINMEYIDMIKDITVIALENFEQIIFDESTS